VQSAVTCFGMERGIVSTTVLKPKYSAMVQQGGVMMTAGALVLVGMKDEKLAFKHLDAAYHTRRTDKEFWQGMRDRAARLGHMSL